MKKSLSVLLASAMVSSMFSSIAFAADLDTQAKHQELVKLGIFDADGTGNGAELTSKMTREQLAKILAKLKGLNEIPGATPYSDVAADRWSAGFINAVSKANPMLMDGVAEGVFNPAGNVTLEQLATVAVRALNLQVDSSATVSGKVSDWAKGYVATAIKNGLIAEKSDFTQDALRSDLVETTYGAKQAIDAQAKVSVTEAKAVGVQKVQVTLSKAVDTTKATFTLKKGSTTITLDTAATKWSDDKKTATLTLKDVKISEGDYTVTLGGIDAAEIATASASFKAENEKVTKLEFVNASEEIAKFKHALIRVKASNQYGENASFSGGNYTAYVNGATKTVSRNDDTGLLEIKDIDTSGLQTGVGVLPVTVFFNNSGVSVTKNFKIGVAPYVAKIELGEVKYPASKTSLTSSGDTASISITRYDQYGEKIAWYDDYDQDFKNQLQVSNQPIITPYSYDALVYDQANSTYDTLKVRLAKNIEKSGDYQVTFYVGAANATATIKTESTKLAAKVEFGAYNGVLAEGDKDAKYIPIVAYDAAGNQLSADDIVDNAKQNRFSISVSGATLDNSGKDSNGNALSNGNGSIVQVGEHKGKIKLNSIDASERGVVYINVGIYTANVQTNVNTSFTVQAKRMPETIVFDGDKPAQKALVGASTDVKFAVKDQYGATLDPTKTNAANFADYRVEVTVTKNTYATYTTDVDPTKFTNPNSGVTSGADKVTYVVYGADFGQLNSKNFKLTAAAAGGKETITATLKDGKGNTIRSQSSSMEVLANNASGLTYSVDAVADLFAALDSSLTPAEDKKLTAAEAVYGKWAINSKLARKLAVSAKDAAGDKVAIPGNRIVSAYTADTTVAKAVYDADNAWVIGNKAGKTDLYVVFRKADGTTQDAQLSLNVKSDVVTAASITADANKSYGTEGTKDIATLMNLKVKDNYGIEYSGADIAKYSAFFGVQYTVSSIKGGGSVKVNNNGTVTISGTVDEFTLKAITNNGKTVSTLVVK